MTLVERLRAFAEINADFVPVAESINTAAADRIEHQSNEIDKLKSVAKELADALEDCSTFLGLDDLRHENCKLNADEAIQAYKSALQGMDSNGSDSRIEQLEAEIHRLHQIEEALTAWQTKGEKLLLSARRYMFNLGEWWADRPWRKR